MPKKDRNVVFLYRGPARGIPWHEMVHAIKAYAGKDSDLALTMTCDVTGSLSLGPQSERRLPHDEEQPSMSIEPLSPETAEKRSTIDDVAREAKVSITTVSRVANDRTCVTPAVRARVEEVMARLSYKPSEAARAMVVTRDEKRRNQKSLAAMNGHGATGPEAHGGDARIAAKRR